MWTVVRGGRENIPLLDSVASLRLRLGEHFDSDPFGTLRPMIVCRLSVSTENLRQGPGIAFFSIAGQFQPQMCVQAILGVPQEVSDFVDTGTFLVSLDTLKIGAHPLMD
jgi:hypothetical protein